MTGNSNYNNVTCPKCGHDQNPTNAVKCEICGKPLKKTLFSPAVYAGLAVLAILCLGGGYFALKNAFKDKLVEKTNTTTPTPTALETAKSEPATTQQTPVQPSQPTVAPTIDTNAAVTPTIDTSLPNPTVLTMDGSTTMVALIQRLRSAYGQTNPNLPTTYGEPNGFPQGSDKGIAALMKNTVVIAGTSRPLKPEEAQAGISVVAIARDAVAVIVGVNNPFQGGLTEDQLRQIYQGKITNWFQVGGPNVPIKVINRALSSGTRDFFQSSVLLEQPFAPDSPNFVTFPQDETTGIIRMLGTNGIGYATVSQTENQQLARVVPIDGISPKDKTTIQNGKYPLSRSVYLAIRKQNSPAVKQFIDLALSPQGQQIAEQSGFTTLK
jgi:phosphate transport system substrate-binding protein